MKLASCCEAELSATLQRSPTVGQRCAAAAGWVVPGVILAVLPKCPACVAAYLAVAGIGVSMTTASYLRVGLMVMCAAALALLAGRWLLRLAAAR
jgi:hypothetical protein